MDGFAALSPDDPYYAPWCDLRRQRRRAQMILVTALISSLIISLLLWNILQVPKLFEGLVFLGVWSVLLLVMFRPLTYRFRWPCPRCGRTFYVMNRYLRRPWDRWPWPTRCVHCKLPEYAPDGAAK